MKTLVIKNSESFLLGLDSLLKHFIYGMEEAGSEIEVINIRAMDINPCRLCTEDPEFYSDGKCECDDDMQMVYPKFREADHIVIATPFTGVMNPQLINFLDRLEPLFSLNGDPDVKTKGSLALISTSTKWDVKTFNPLVDHLSSFSPVISRYYAGALLRPHSLAYDMSDMDENDRVEINNAAEALGKSFINTRSFDKADLETVAMPLTGYEEYKDYIKDNIYQ